MSGIEELEALGRHIADREAAVAPSPEEHERLRAIVVERAFAERRSGYGNRWTFGMLVAAALLGVVTLLFVRRTPEPLSFFVGPHEDRGTVGAWMSAQEASALPVRFSDGTRASLLPKGRARVVSVSPFGANVVVESGTARFDVVPRPNGEWRVNTGPFVVHVTGTRFEVEWRADRDAFALELYEGHVRISGCDLDEPYPVRAGERIEASCGRHEFRVAPIGSAGETANEAVGAPVAASPKSGAEQAPEAIAIPGEPGPVAAGDHKPAPREQRGTPSDSRVTAAGAATDAPPRADFENRWIDLARRGLYADAFAAAEERGFDAEREARSATEVLLLGDVARFSGHADRARLAYQSVRQRFPGTPSAALAAFQLGRDDFDRRGDVAGAERWLRVYLEEAPSGGLAPAAMGRLMEAEVRQGNRAEAQKLAATYLERFPKGPHAEAAERVLGAAPGPGSH
jgi:TolA-binding protein